MDDNFIASRIVLKAEREVAYHSPDHIMPWGTRRDNSRNKRFNQKLYALYPSGSTLRILDIGCAGGGFVKDCIDDGHLAVGLEGSDYSSKLRRAEWATIPDFLFTCDVTADFDLFVQTPKGLERLQFDVVTSWEFIEHIAESELGSVASHVKKHLKPGGLWIMSVSPNEEVIDDIRLHQTVQQKPWWIGKFATFGFKHLEEYVKYFNTQFVRGPKQGAPGSFHLVLTTADQSQVSPIPKQKLTTRIYDRWWMSYPQKALSRLIVGTP